MTRRFFEATLHSYPYAVLESAVLSGFLALGLACASPPRAPLVASSAPPNEVAAWPTNQSATTAVPVSTRKVTPHPRDAENALHAIDEYQDCAAIRSTESGAMISEELTKARNASWLWPDRCGAVQGWAGIGIVQSQQAIGFSGDDKRFLVCGIEEDCLSISLARGLVDRRVRPIRPNGLDGEPVTRLTEIAKLFRDAGAPAKEGAFPYANDCRVSWALGKGGLTLDVTLVENVSGTEIAIQHFPRSGHVGDQPLVLTGAMFSPSGSVLALSVWSGQGGSGYDVGLVNLHAAASRLFRKMAELDPKQANGWLAKAKQKQR